MSKKYRVVITDFINDSLEIEREILSEIAEVEALDAMGEGELKGKIEDADAIMLYHNLALTSTTIQSLNHCKLIVRCGVGFDNVDHAFARQCGIAVANVPDYGTEEVADSAMGMLLSLTRGIHLYNTRLREQPIPWMYSVSGPLYRHRGRVLGIIGLGRIGTAMARRGLAMGMDVRFYDPLKPDGYDKAVGVRRVESLKELLEQSFVVSVHCPLTLENHHMINAETIDWLPMGSYLINTARGEVVDTDVIAPAIARGRLAGAGIDVLAVEPPSEQDPMLVAWRDPKHPAYERLIVNPHAAFYCEEGLADMRSKGAQACRRALLGETLRNVIN